MNDNERSDTPVVQRSRGPWVICGCRGFLTSLELEELTGARLASKQAEVLRRHGIYFVERLDGKIRTTWHHVNHPFDRMRDEQPDFSALDG